MITGGNIENASYPVGTCAERVALGKAVVSVSFFNNICSKAKEDWVVIVRCGMQILSILKSAMDNLYGVARNTSHLASRVKEIEADVHTYSLKDIANSRL